MKQFLQFLRKFQWEKVGVIGEERISSSFKNVGLSNFTFFFCRIFLLRKLEALEIAGRVATNQDRSQISNLTSIHDWSNIHAKEKLSVCKAPQHWKQ